MHRWWHCPVPMDLSLGDGAPERIEFNYVGNGYNYEAAEVVRCVREDRKESSILTLDFSLRLIRLLDRIRRHIGLVYDADSPM